jgi:SAM-dependent methyltransferase
MLDRRTATQSHLTFLQSLGFPRPSRVLDFGCGTGEVVRQLLDLGCDAYGADIQDLWSTSRNTAIADRLHLLDLKHYRLPFDDTSFELVLSDEVFEHVKDYRSAFREILRVLKPGGISAHRFPGPLTLFEAHTHVPISALCHFKPYLTAWALLGVRTPDQRGMSWRVTLASNLGMMGSVVYPTKATIRRYAKDVGADVQFVERAELLHRDFGRAGEAVTLAKRFGLGEVAAAVLAPLGQRYMLLRHAQN